MGRLSALALQACTLSIPLNLSFSRSSVFVFGWLVVLVLSSKNVQTCQRTLGPCQHRGAGKPRVGGGGGGSFSIKWLI